MNNEFKNMPPYQAISISFEIIKFRKILIIPECGIPRNSMNSELKCDKVEMRNVLHFVSHVIL